MRKHPQRSSPGCTQKLVRHASGGPNCVQSPVTRDVMLRDHIWVRSLRLGPSSRVSIQDAPEDGRLEMPKARAKVISL